VSVVTSTTPTKVVEVVVVATTDVVVARVEVELVDDVLVELDELDDELLDEVEVLELDDVEELDELLVDVELEELDELEDVLVEEVLLVEVDELDEVLVDEVLVEVVVLSVVLVDDVLLVEVDEVDELLVDDVLVDEVLEELDELDDELLVEVELVDDVLVVLDVVVAFGLHCAGSGLTNCGTATAVMQSTLNSVTQSTQSTMSCASRMAPSHDDAPGGVTSGQLATKPICAGVASPLPLQSLSAPPHALQMLEIFFVSALPMRSCALPSPGTGQGFECLFFRRASQHFCSAFDFAARNFTVDLPIACWHLLTALLLPNSPCSSAA
jgi:hypothetical protein